MKSSKTGTTQPSGMCTLLKPQMAITGRTIRRAVASYSKKTLLPVSRYYAYIEITRRAHQTLWREYQSLAESHDNFAMQNIRSAEEIFPVFRELFKRQVEA